MTTYSKSISALALACSLFAGCEKVIDLDTKDGATAIVIVGEISDAPGPYLVSLSQTVNFNELNTFPTVEYATVVVADNQGAVDTFLHIGKGVYQSQGLQGVSGRTYNLTVLADGKTYTATSALPQPVPFLDLKLTDRVFFGDTTYTPTAVYNDPIGEANYYYFVQTVNGKVLQPGFARSDRFNDGKMVEAALRNRDVDLKVGDSVYIEMQSIDKAAYDYLSTLRDVDGTTNTAAPANPVSNISGGALGYFSAHTVQGKSVVR